MTQMFSRATPTVTSQPAPTMPSLNDPEEILARKRAIADAQARAGRASTILTSRDTGGSGDSYSGTRLGQ